MILNKYSRIRTLHVCGYQVFIIFPNVRDNIAAALALTKDQLTLKLSSPLWVSVECSLYSAAVYMSVPVYNSLLSYYIIPLNIYIRRWICYLQTSHAYQ